MASDMNFCNSCSGTTFSTYANSYASTNQHSGNASQAAETSFTKSYASFTPTIATTTLNPNPSVSCIRCGNALVETGEACDLSTLGS